MSPGKRRPRGDGGLFKRADGMWIGVVELPIGGDGKRRRKYVSSKNRNEAIRKLKQLRADVLANRIAVTSSATVEQWLERWLNDIHKRKVRPGTFAGDERIIRLHINPHIGRRRLDQLTPAHIRQMHDAIDSSRSAQLAHGLLQKALKDAEREGMVGRNVALLVDKPGHVAEEREPLTAEQAKQLLRSAINTNDPWATRWAAALLLGARQGELLGLQWSRVDLEAGEVDLSMQLQVINPVHGCGERHSDGTWPCGRKRPGACPKHKWDLPRGFKHEQLDGSLFLTPPKTKGRIVPIPAPLWALLDQYQKVCHVSAKNPHDLVWHHDDGKPIDRYTDYDNWQAALKTAGLPPAPLHVARHTTATLLALANVPESVGMAILGHASVQVHRGYAHGDTALSRTHMDRALNELLA
jgi:integrase